MYLFAGYALTYSDKVVPSRDTSSKVACKLKLTYEFGLPHFLLSPQTHEVCGGPNTILYAAYTQEKCSKNTLFLHFCTYLRATPSHITTRLYLRETPTSLRSPTSKVLSLYAAYTQEKCSKNTLFLHFSCVYAFFVVPLQAI